jgi:hypothetical protein
MTTMTMSSRLDNHCLGVGRLADKHDRADRGGRQRIKQLVYIVNRHIVVGDERHVGTRSDAPGEALGRVATRCGRHDNIDPRHACECLLAVSESGVYRMRTWTLTIVRGA